MEAVKSVKTFTFEDGPMENKLAIVIHENMEASYGMYVWPCSPVLAQYVWFNKNLIRNKTVLEIGAGTALPGLVAAKCGAKVILTDSEFSQNCHSLCKANIEANNLQEGLDVIICGLTWGTFCPSLLELPPVDVILGSDCFYDPEEFEPVIAVVSFILEKNPQARFWCTYQERSADWSIEYLLKKWKLSCCSIPLEEFGVKGGSVAGSDMPGRHVIQMLEITLLQK